MAVNKQTFNSVGGFAVNETPVINDTRDVLNVNTLEIKNINYSDSTKKNYILKGTNTAILSIDNSNTPLNLNSNTINFITAHIVAVNASGSGHLSVKLESAVTCNASGDVQVLSELLTTIKDSVPSGETWTIISYDSGAANKFSYAATRGGTIVAIKWFAHVEVVSVLWS
jgi:hypothetical protein